MLIIGLTGGIASGKSTVSDFLAALGAVVIDADKLAREVVRPGQPGWQRIKETWGEEYFLPDLNLDRKKLGRAVFSTPAVRSKLDELLHPCLKAAVKEKIAFWLTADNKPPMLVIDAALLLEAGWEDLVDEVWVVFCPPDLQLARLRLRDNFSEAEARARCEAQMSPAERQAKADVLLNNAGTEAELKSQVKKLWEERLC